MGDSKKKQTQIQTQVKGENRIVLNVPFEQVLSGLSQVRKEEMEEEMEKDKKKKK